MLSDFRDHPLSFFYKKKKVLIIRILKLGLIIVGIYHNHL